MKVLVADDEDITRLLLISALTKLGHEVYEAEDGSDAWEAWKHEHHPLVIRLDDA